MTDPNVIIVDPSAIKWGREPVLALTRPAGEGALMRADYCRNKVCQCSEVAFEIDPIDGPLAGVSADDPRIGRLLEDRPVAPDASRFGLDLQIGKFVWIGRLGETVDEDSDQQEILLRGEGVSDEMVALAHALEQSIDGKVLDELWSRHLLARGLDQGRLVRRPPNGYEQGKIEWSEVCPTARPDVFIDAVSDMTAVAHDYYCPQPSCACAEAHVYFSTLEGSMGSVVVGFDSDELRIAPEEGWSADELAQVWNHYVERWPDYRARLRERYHRLRAALDNAMRRRPVSAVTTTPNRNQTKVGRNEPCPCGSGRKYKRCCGDPRQT